MVQQLIAVEIPQQRVTFRSGGAPASFPVIVYNNSDQQAQFYLEVQAAGADPQLQAEWCRRSPEVSVATPPGDRTTFKIEVFATPIPDFVGIVDLTITVFSPQLPDKARRIVKLTIAPGEENASFSIRLLSPIVQVYPNNVADLPVQVRNLSTQPLEMHLWLSGIPEPWMLNGGERRRRLNPKETAEIAFQCQPPAARQALSQEYPIQVNASSGATSSQANGTLKVLPIGFIKFSVTPPKQSIPFKRGLLDWNTHSARFQAAFENVSNQVQQIGFDLRGHDRDRCACEIPTSAELGLAAFAQIPFDVTTHRPWLGLAKTLRLEAVAQPQMPHSVDVEPAVQPIELQVLPVIPLWLALALLGLLATLLAFLLQPTPVGHTDFVNAVRFSSDALSAVSGSDDCTIRRWTIAGDRLKPEGVLADAPATTCNDEPLQAEGALSFLQQTIFSLEFLPENNDRIAAGLANGAIQVWELPSRQQVDELRDQEDNTEDRVFDLAFTKDALTLFSGHGSGKIRVWQRSIGKAFHSSTPAQVLTLPESTQHQVKYQVRALALSPDNQTLVSAGSKNTLILWNRTDSTQPPRLLMPQESEEDYVWDVGFAPHSQRLATSDSKGSISLWDLERCPGYATPADAACQPLERWRAVEGEGNIAVRSLKFNSDGTRLVSAGDDGRVVLWNLMTTPPSKDEVLFTSSQKISAVDLVETDRELLIVSGGDDRQVRLHRIKLANHTP